MSEKERLCVRCVHSEMDHAEFIDNQSSSANYVPERRRCLVEYVAGHSWCTCVHFVAPSEPHQVSKSSTDEEIMASDNKVVKDNYEKSLDEVLEADEVVDVARKEPICDDCVNSKYPGIVWPIDFDNQDKAWIQRCDACDLFAGDREAAYFLSAVTGIPIALGEYNKDCYIFYTPIPRELVDTMSRASRLT